VPGVTQEVKAKSIELSAVEQVAKVQGVAEGVTEQVVEQGS
jgi:hypothetical protein